MGVITSKQGGLLTALLAGLLVSKAALADLMPSITTDGAPSTAARAVYAVQGCPDRGGLLDSISVPVGQPLNLRVQIGAPAPRGGATFQPSSNDAAIVAAGDRRQGFLPRVLVPEGHVVAAVAHVRPGDGRQAASLQTVVAGLLSNTAVAGLVAGLCVAQGATGLALVRGATRWTDLIAVLCPLGILAICANRMQLGSSGTGLRGVEILFLSGNLVSAAQGCGACAVQSRRSQRRWP